MNPVFELNDLHVSLQSHHQEIELVRGVSFAVAPGECLGILRESGSGKSMSMKAAMGLLDHRFHVKGSAQFQGEDLLGKSAEELRRLRGGKVGIILQNPMTCFDPLYRIGQQIAETFSAHNNWTAEEIRARSLELLEKMRIRIPEEVLEKYPDLKGYYATNQATSEAVLSVLDKHTDRSVQMIGVDMGDTQKKAIEDGKEVGSVCQNPYGMGYATIVAGARASLGLESDKKIDSGFQWNDKNTIGLEEYARYLY